MSVKKILIVLFLVIVTTMVFAGGSRTFSNGIRVTWDDYQATFENRTGSTQQLAYQIIFEDGTKSATSIGSMISGTREFSYRYFKKIRDVVESRGW